MNLAPGLSDAWTIWLARRLPLRLDVVKWMRRWPGTRQIIKGRGNRL